MPDLMPYLPALLHSLGLALGLFWTYVLMTVTVTRMVDYICHVWIKQDYAFKIPRRWYVYATAGWVLFALPFWI